MVTRYTDPESWLNPDDGDLSIKRHESKCPFQDCKAKTVEIKPNLMECTYCGWEGTIWEGDNLELDRKESKENGVR